MGHLLDIRSYRHYRAVRNLARHLPLPPRMSLDFPTAVLDFLFLIAPAKIAKR